jgi:hypothetical protein
VRSNLNELRIAIVHYWFVARRGGERVVEALAEMFPQADFYTLVLDRKALAPSRSSSFVWTITTSSSALNPALPKVSSREATPVISAIATPPCVMFGTLTTGIGRQAA